MPTFDAITGLVNRVGPSSSTTVITDSGVVTRGTAQDD